MQKITSNQGIVFAAGMATGGLLIAVAGMLLPHALAWAAPAPGGVISQQEGFNYSGWFLAMAGVSIAILAVVASPIIASVYARAVVRERAHSRGVEG